MRLPPLPPLPPFAVFSSSSSVRDRERICPSRTLLPEPEVGDRELVLGARRRDGDKTRG